ncbi:hypothetical protein pb186bvf_009720 [Paramecium bursaria]
MLFQLFQDIISQFQVFFTILVNLFSLFQYFKAQNFRQTNKLIKEKK